MQYTVIQFGTGVITSLAYDAILENIAATDIVEYAFLYWFFVTRNHIYSQHRMDAIERHHKI